MRIKQRPAKFFRKKMRRPRGSGAAADVCRRRPLAHGFISIAVGGVLDLAGEAVETAGDVLEGVGQLAGLVGGELHLLVAGDASVDALRQPALRLVEILAGEGRLVDYTLELDEGVEYRAGAEALKCGACLFRKFGIERFFLAVVHFIL